MKGTRIFNNLVNGSLDLEDPREFVQGELGPELKNNGPGAIDEDAFPTAASKAIDAGIPVPGVTDGFQGAAPDLGAYEFRGPRWKPGADWSDPDAPKAPPRNLQYTPRGPVDENSMILDGLVLWLDASDRATLDVDSDGNVLAWRDKSPGKRVAKADDSKVVIHLIGDALGGRSVVRGTGKGRLLVPAIRNEPGQVTALVLSRGIDASGPTWQRIIQCYSGEGKTWERPNWEIMRPAGKQPEPYGGRVFIVEHSQDASLGELRLAAGTADVAEILIFDRSLRFDELQSVAQYLRTKWSVK